MKLDILKSSFLMLLGCVTLAALLSAGVFLTGGSNRRSVGLERSAYLP
ncbi:hypothetical protein [Roseibium alexandrii]